MNCPDFTRRTAALILVASLAACGGGGGGGSDAVTPAPTPTPTPVSVTGQYISQPIDIPSVPRLAAWNEQGARGFAFLATLSTNQVGPYVEMGDFYVSDSVHSSSRLEYETVAQPSSADALVTQFNEQGSRGFAYKAPLFVGGTSNPASLTVRDASRSITFSYERQPNSSGLGRDAFQAQLNEQGARGYRLIGPVQAGTESFNLYVKDSSATTYTYTLFDGGGSSGVGTGDALRARLNAQGAQGQLFLGAFKVQGNGSTQVFERSSAQSGAIEYDVRTATPQASISQLRSAFNERAAQGLFFFSDLVTADGNRFTVSVRNAANLRDPLAGITFP